MSKKGVFISCGQFTPAEKQLGKRISEMVKNVTGLEPFFAEEVHDLNGLHANILGALHDCVGFITVLHPRGTIHRPDGSIITRASVWIEQEIAIAAYIQHVEHRELPTIVFKHASVDREGLRDLLHLNPIEFNDEAEVLAALPGRLEKWKSIIRRPTLEVVRLNKLKTRANDGSERLFVQILVKCASPGSLDDCRGQFTGVLKKSAGDPEWTPLIDQPLPLYWGTIDEPTRTLWFDVPEPLNIFFIDNVERRIVPWSRSIPNFMADALSDVSSSDSLRFNILITAKDCAPVGAAVEVGKANEWDQISVSMQKV